MVRRISVVRMSAARRTPSSPPAMRPYRYAATDETGTGTEGDGARRRRRRSGCRRRRRPRPGRRSRPTISGRTSSGTVDRSSCRPPWFETTTASAPRSTTARASATSRMPLTTRPAVPRVTQPGHVGEGHARVERTTQPLRQRALSLVERDEPQRLHGEEVERPCGVTRRVEDGPGSQRGRQGEAVPQVTPARTGHGHVDGEHQRRVAVGPNARQQIPAGGPIAPDVELEPVVPGRRGGHQVGRRRRAAGRQRVRDAHVLRDPGDRPFTFAVHQPGRPRRREHERERGRRAQDRGGRIHHRDVVEHPGPELDPGERGSRLRASPSSASAAPST